MTYSRKRVWDKWYDVNLDLNGEKVRVEFQYSQAELNAQMRKALKNAGGSSTDGPIRVIVKRTKGAK